MSEMQQTRLDFSSAGSSPSVRRTVTYKASDLAMSSKAGDVTIQHISEAKGYLNEFEQMYRKHRVEIDSLKRDHASEVSLLLHIYVRTRSSWVYLENIRLLPNSCGGRLSLRADNSRRKFYFRNVWLVGRTVNRFNLPESKPVGS